MNECNLWSTGRKAVSFDSHAQVPRQITRFTLKACCQFRATRAAIDVLEGSRSLRCKTYKNKGGCTEAVAEGRRDHEDRKADEALQRVKFAKAFLRIRTWLSRL
jgi:hypothetical protein